MANQQQADLTLAFHQERLLRNKNVCYIAVISKFDENERPTDEFILEVGVYNLQHQLKLEEQNREKAIEVENEEFVPRFLRIPNEDSQDLTDQTLEVIIKETDGFFIQSFTDRLRPAKGGCSISNYRYNSAGTLGSAIKLKNDSGFYFISNWHVLDRGGGKLGDPILQPGRLDGGAIPGDIIGNLHWSSLTEKMDAAIAVVSNPASILNGTRCFGLINGVETAQIGMKVKKCGRTTELTEGWIRSINATIVVSGYPGGNFTFKEQILTTNMSDLGDSGSLLVNEKNNAVGLLFAGDSSQSVHNHIEVILGGTIEPFIVQHPDGSQESMPEIDL